ncbi:MAG: hypothetical protein ACQKBY_10880 [Verrucomicrobiales bacterium]
MDPTPAAEDQNLDEITRESAELEEQIYQFESYLEEAPNRLREEQEKQRSTMPAPDDLVHLARVAEIERELLSRGSLSNQARKKATNTILLILFALALVSLVLWIVSSLKHNGILS